MDVNITRADCTLTVSAFRKIVVLVGVFLIIMRRLTCHVSVIRMMNRRLNVCVLTPYVKSVPQ